MNIFANEQASHEHSLRTLGLLANFNDFMDSISTICDMGCGIGNDLAWWATRTYLDDNDVERPYNYRCIGVDTDTSRSQHNISNMEIFNGDFETYKLDAPADVLWSHDSFRYAINPLATLKHWRNQMTDNGMLVMIVPQTINIAYNKLSVRSLPLNYYHYTITNLLYMLAVNGFDCNAGHFVKYPNDPWVHCVAYRSDIEPMDPKTTSWYTLADKKLLPDTAIACIDRYGYLKQEELQTHWLDRQFCNWNQL
jgi:SAM-dependent methyltransferase